MRDRFTVTIRSGGKVRRSRFPTLDAALEHLEGTLRPIAAATDRPTARAFSRLIEPSAQVAVRGEIAGRGAGAAGIDVMGDGSCSAFTGRLRRQTLTGEPHEDAFQTLRRTVSEQRPA